MLKTNVGKIVVAVATIALSGTSFIALADNAVQKSGNEQSTAAASNQSSQKGDQGPEVRFGNPSRTITSDEDQQSYDRTDGGISGISVSGSRVFSARVANAAAPKPATTVLNLLPHTGSPMPVTHIYSIYWGPSFVSNYQTTVNSFLGAIGASSNRLNGLTTQYFKSGSNSTSYVTSNYTDLSTPPSSAPTTSSILAEVYKVIVTNNKLTIDPAGLYMVFTNNYPSRANYCAWHGAGSVNRSANFTVAYQPYLGGVAGCSPVGLSGFQTFSAVPGMDAVANVASHEIYETITDPFLNAWFDANGAEIGDKCAWYSGYTKLSGTYSLQTEWSNSAKACASS